MENDQGTRGLPASDGPLQGLFGGARRYAERATNLSAGQSGGSPSGELGRLTDRAPGQVSACCAVMWPRDNLFLCITHIPAKVKTVT